MGSDFRINLYRRVLATDGQGVMDPRMTADIDTDDTIDTKTDTNDTKILGLIDKNPTITQVELKERLGLSIATVKRIMADMQKRGVIERKGSSRKGKWIISSSKE
jgi:ATP-dependent DNA helicase RecG